MHRRVLALLVGVLCSAACSRAAQESDRETVYQAESVLTVRVINRSQLDATIYLVHDGTRERLGTVTAASTGTFPVRTRILGTGDFALMADPVGLTRTTTTEMLRAGQGTDFTWTLESDFTRGSLIVRND